jgi:titin
VESDVTSYTDTCEPETTYTYRVRAFNDAGNSAYSNEDQVTTQAATTAPDTTAPDTTAPGTTTGRTVLRFYIDSTEYYVQGPSDTSSRLQTMDTAPIISESRTLLPIRYVSEPLGAVVNWDGALDQVTVHLGNRTIVLWINNGTARVNGVETAIDPANPAVTPIIVPPGRTMLSLRFIAENLGCEVSWNPATREVTVIYPKE